MPGAVWHCMLSRKPFSFWTIHCAGMTFGQLYRVSREQLLVANDTALRAHLTEFKDHDLLQTRCGAQISHLISCKL